MAPIMGAVNIRLVTAPRKLMLTTGNQLRAARALVDIGQVELADAAKVNVNTIRAMEGRKAQTLSSGLDTVRAVQAALETRGVRFIAENGGGPGVRLEKRTDA